MFGGYNLELMQKELIVFCLDPCFTGCLVGTESRGLGRKSWNFCLDPCFTGCLVGTHTLWEALILGFLEGKIYNPRKFASFFGVKFVPGRWVSPPGFLNLCQRSCYNGEKNLQPPLLHILQKIVVYQ